MNPNALPKSATLQDFQNFGDDLNSTDYNDTLNAMQYMQGLRQPTGGLNRLPQVTVPMQEGGGMEEAMMQEQGMSIQPMNPEEQAMMMQQVEQQEPREPNPEIQSMAQQVASYGRGGDKLLLHMRPDELEGLSSMLTITINPTTGMPEAFINKIVKGAKRIVKGAAKGVKNVVKSDAFKTIAPIALAIAAPYALAYLAPAGTFAGATLGAQVAAMGPIAFGAATGVGSLTGNLLAGRNFKDAAKAGLISGFTAGTIKGVGNKMAGKTFMGNPTEASRQTILSEGRALEVGNSVPNSFDGTTYYPGKDGGYGGTFTDPKVTEANNLLAAKNAESANTLEAFRKQQVDIAARNADNVISGGGFTPTVDPVSTMPDPYAPNLFKRTTSAIGEYVPQSVKDISGAIAQDFNPMTKSGLINIATKGVAGDLGSSVVSMQEQNEQARRLQEEEDDRLRREGYTVEYPDGYNSQRVVYDSTGVVPVRTVAEILNRALGGGRYLYRGRTVYEPTEDVVETAQGGLISLGMGGFLDKIKTLMPTGKEPNVTTVPTEEQQSEAFSNEATNIEDQQIIDEYLKVVREQPYEVEKVYAPGTSARRLLEEAFKARNMPLPFAQGGLISMARGSEFSGMVPGDGGGMEDNVYMPIKEGPEQVGTLAVSPSEYVVDSYTMAALGGGNPAEGAKVMDETIKNIRKKAYGNTKQPKEVDGLSALTPMVQGV